jgi:transcriptional regulator with XRE-family HTH domain
VTIGERLRTTRRERDMSLADLARVTGLSRGFISQVESGKSNPSLASLRKLTAALGLHAGAFFDDTQGASVLPSGNLGLERPGPQLSNSPILQIFSLESSKGPGWVRIREDEAGGTAALLSLPIGSGAFGQATSAAIGGSVLCAVLRGEVRITQGQRAIVARQGEVASLDPVGAYNVTCAASSDASIFLTLPPGCQLPTLTDLSLLEQSMIRPLAGSGPFRLVEMRAAVRAAGRAYRR